MAARDSQGAVPSIHPVVLQGERVSLREVGPDDATAAFAWAGDPRFFRYMAPEPVGSIAEEAEFLRDLQQQARARPRVQYHLGVVERSGEELIGMVRLGIAAPKFRGADVGYGLRADRWGQGITAEAVGLVLAFGFEQLGLHRIAAVCDPNNIGSRRVMEKVGMQPEGRLREDMRSQGRWRDSLAYAILEHEWRAGRSADGTRH
jgi:[ribosomal protein S5]-alanine N-acetyltransferase